MFSEHNFTIKHFYNYKNDSNFYHFIKNDDANNSTESVQLFDTQLLRNELNLASFYSQLKNKIKSINIQTPFFICPSGVYGKMVYYYLNEDTKKNIIGFLDSDARKINKRLTGTNCTILEKTHIKSLEEVSILIISERYKMEIVDELNKYNDKIQFIFM
jgi:FlaA1/EpsC-like NDP-sugar epimerase